MSTAAPAPTRLLAPSAPACWARLGLLGSLYLAQGLPFGFFTQALPVLLRSQGRSLGEIGLSSLLALHTVQASAVVIATGLASTLSGLVAQRLGYPLHFASSAAVALIATLLTPWLLPPLQIARRLVGAGDGGMTR